MFFFKYFVNRFLSVIIEFKILEFLNKNAKNEKFYQELEFARLHPAPQAQILCFN